MLQENWWQQDRSGQGMNERRNFAKGKRQQRWPATHIVKEEVGATRAKHGGEVPIEQMCFDEGWDTLGDDKSRSPTRGAHIVRACTTAWSPPGGRFALIVLLAHVLEVEVHLVGGEWAGCSSSLRGDSASLWRPEGAKLPNQRANDYYWSVHFSRHLVGFISQGTLHKVYFAQYIFLCNQTSSDLF